MGNRSRDIRDRRSRLRFAVNSRRGGTRDRGALACHASHTPARTFGTRDEHMLKPNTLASTPWRRFRCLRRLPSSCLGNALCVMSTPRMGLYLTSSGHQSACSNAPFTPRPSAPPHLHARSHTGFSQGPHARSARRPRLSTMSEQHIPSVRPSHSA
jgi:hypothetical protein